MNYTPNHHLPQWVKSDRIMMDDFNAAMASIESGITTAQSTASSAATAASRAQSTANTAQTAANRAQAAADALPYAAGTYKGTGGTLSVSTGFRPSMVIICGTLETVGGGGYGDFGKYGCITSGHTVSRHVVFTSTGFNVINDPDGSNGYPWINSTGRTYDYIAFK